MRTKSPKIFNFRDYLDQSNILDFYLLRRFRQTWLPYFQAPVFIPIFITAVIDNLEENIHIILQIIYIFHIVHRRPKGEVKLPQKKTQQNI